MHPMDENLAGYLLNALDEDARRAFEVCLRTNPETRRKVARLRALMAPLEADRDAIEPPVGLARATLARIGAARPMTLPAAPRLAPGQVGGRSWWRRADVLATAATLLIALGLGASWLIRTWQRSAVVACKENLHKFHRALVAYTETREDRAFPRVEAEGPRAVAGIFVPLLTDAGVLGEDVSLTCPAEGHRSPPLERGQVRKLEELYRTDRGQYLHRVKHLAGCYAYSLGYREGEGLRGLHRGESNDLMPILADGPPSRAAAEDEAGNSLNHGGSGQNVLTVGGSVRYCTSRGVGLNGDDIFLNKNRRVLAGVYHTDTVLGVSDSVP